MIVVGMIHIYARAYTVVGMIDTHIFSRYDGGHARGESYQQGGEA